MTALAVYPRTTFEAPAERTAPSPAERRGLERDQVRLLVASRDGIEHTRFRSLPDYLNAGDLVVVNNSATVAGQIDARRADGSSIVLHAATPLDDGTWVVELRSAPDAARAILDAQVGEHLEVGSLVLRLQAPYPFASSPTGSGNRLWRAEVDGDLGEQLWHHGRPISYGYLDRAYPEPRLIPEEPASRGRALEIAQTIACEIHPINNLRVLKYLTGELGVDEAAKSAWYQHWVAEGLGAVEQLLDAGPEGQFCVGDAPTIADCCLVPQVANALRMGCELGGLTRVMQVYERCMGMERFVSAAPQSQPDYIK